MKLEFALQKQFWFYKKCFHSRRSVFLTQFLVLNILGIRRQVGNVHGRKRFPYFLDRLTALFLSNRVFSALRALSLPRVPHHSSNCTVDTTIEEESVNPSLLYISFCNATTNIELQDSNKEFYSSNPDSSHNISFGFAFDHEGPDKPDDPNEASTPYCHGLYTNTAYRAIH
jgi:hypothetical protein